MKITAELTCRYFGKAIRVTCENGWEGVGLWSGHTSALDNEPDGESIIIDMADGSPVEIYVDDITRIDEATEVQGNGKDS